MSRTVRVAVVAAVVALLGAACTSTEDSSSRDDGPAASSTTVVRECTPDRPTEVVAAPVTGSTHDLDITSFDGTTIRAHWFPVEGATDVPTVLMGPGWGMAGDTDVDAVGVLGAVNIAVLRDAGYNVLTWDPRGFGASGGTAQVDSPDHEGRDVQVLLDWVAAQPEVRTDADGDPAVGMVGGSYGGGIQLVAAAIDCRIDAIVPIVAWHSLVSSLYPRETFKQGWADVLSAVGARAHLDPMVAAANEQGRRIGVLTAEQVDWFAARGPADRVSEITAPTLLVGGTVDTLFPLAEDVANYRALRDAGTDVSMFWFCGGHGTCLADKGDEQRMVRRVVAWLDRWVKRDPTVDTGPRIDVIDQQGRRHVADDYPGVAGEPLIGRGSGTLELAAGGGSGPATIPPGKADVLAGVAGRLIPAPASRAIEVEVPVPADSLALGAPRLTLTYTGTAPAGDRPTRVFAQLVDPASGLVIGNQIAPVPVVLDGSEHRSTVDLEVISHRVTEGSPLVLQLVATSTLYLEPGLGGRIEVSEAAIEVPTATGYRAG